MHILFYTHSLVSDWNHGNAHFQRGVMRELINRGHLVRALEPENSWSRAQLKLNQGASAEAAFSASFPELLTQTYNDTFDHEAALAQADLVVVHEWTDASLVARIGRARRRERFTLLFHDTHHRAVSADTEIASLALEDYDAILAFGETLRARYLRVGWGQFVFTWHEAADTSLFRPNPHVPPSQDLIWIGNWGDGERSQEIENFLVEPARRLALTGSVRGVRYPQEALLALARTNLSYGGWIANARVPVAFASHRATIHIPRRPYVEALRGIPTIRMFEALACGIPLVSAPWPDDEGLFRTGIDYVSVADSDAMTAALREIINDPELAATRAKSGLETIEARHTCVHRVDELFGILTALGRAAATDQVVSP